MAGSAGPGPASENMAVRARCDLGWKQGGGSPPKHFCDEEDDDGSEESAAKKHIDHRIADGGNRSEGRDKKEGVHGDRSEWRFEGNREFNG